MKIKLNSISPFERMTWMDDWDKPDEEAKAQTKKQLAQEIYNQMKNDPELQKEVNMLLRKEKLKRLNEK